MSNLPVNVEKASIFTKIKNWFKKVFKKRDEEKVIPQEITTKTFNDSNNKEVFKEELQSAIKQQEKRKKILDYIENDENSIYNLSNEKLKELIKIYDDEIQNVDTQIKQLKYDI